MNATVTLYTNYSPISAVLVGPFKDTLAEFRTTHLTPSTTIHYHAKLAVGSGWILSNDEVDSLVRLLEDQDFEFEVKSTPKNKRAARPSYSKMWTQFQDMFDVSDVNDKTLPLFQQFIMSSYRNDKKVSDYHMRKVMGLSPVKKMKEKKEKRRPKNPTYIRKIGYALYDLQEKGEPVSYSSIKKYVLGNYLVSGRLSDIHLYNNLRRGVTNGYFIYKKQSFTLTKEGQKVLCKM